MDNLKFRRSKRSVEQNDNPDVEKLSRREQKKADRGGTDVPKKTFWVQIRIIPIWLRLILIILLIGIVSIIGLRIGYSYIGDGNPEDVLKKETWVHILDIIKGKE